MKATNLSEADQAVLTLKVASTSLRVASDRHQANILKAEATQGEYVSAMWEETEAARATVDKILKPKKISSKKRKELEAAQALLDSEASEEETEAARATVDSISAPKKITLQRQIELDEANALLDEVSAKAERLYSEMLEPSVSYLEHIRAARENAQGELDELTEPFKI